MTQSSELSPEEMNHVDARENEIPEATEREKEGEGLPWKYA
jgi:hypothetical protein